MNRKGFTLLESLIAMVLVSVVSTAIYQQLANTRRTQNALSQKLESRQLLEMELSRMKGTFSSFPLLKKAGTNTVATYIRCYTRTFAPSKNKDGSTDFVAIDLTDVEKPAPESFCPAVFEVHIQPVETAMNTARIYVFMPMSQTKDRFIYQTQIELQPGL